jgi:hypothetical protein
MASLSAISASAVSLSVADFLVRTEIERLALFRLHLRTSVNRISPLLLELALMEGIALGDAVALMYPPQDWPWRPLYDDPPAPLRRSQQRRMFLGSKGLGETQRFRRTFAKPGVVIRDIDHPRGRFAVRPCNGVLGFTAAIGPCLLSGFGAAAMLKLPEPLPETLMMAMPGRRLGGIIDHPVFRDRAYRIVRVLPDLADGSPVLTFRVPLVPFELSWPESAGSGDRW